MCIFSGPVRHVGGTRIFARPLDDGRQALAYAMRVAQDQELAMILPLPTPIGAAEDAVELVDLSGAADLFDQLELMFPATMTMAFAAGMRGPAPQSLKVHQVGAFNASFVPAVADFARLDPSFRLPPRVWDQLPQYADHGFCVFALRPAAGGERPGLIGRMLGRGSAQAPARDVHPMGFVFPRRDPDQVFFPTLHVHDGEVHATAGFDHTLYLQADAADAAMLDWSWEMSRMPAEPSPEAQAMVSRDRHVHRRVLRGALPNRDQVSSIADEARCTRVVGPCAVQLDGPWSPSDAALLDGAAARLVSAAGALGAPIQPFDPRLPAVSAQVAAMHGRLNLRTEARLIGFEHVFPDQRHLRARVAVSTNPGAAGSAALTAALIA